MTKSGAYAWLHRWCWGFPYHIWAEVTPNLSHYETDVTPEEHLADRALGGRDNNVQILNAHKIKLKDSYIQILYVLAVLLNIAYFLNVSFSENSIIEFDELNGVLISNVKVPDQDHIVNTSTLPYCKEGGHPCQVWDSREIVYPLGSTDNTLSITTFAREKRFNRTCERGADVCTGKVLQEVENDAILVAGVEDLQVRIDHIVQAPLLYMSQKKAEKERSSVRQDETSGSDTLGKLVTYLQADSIERYVGSCRIMSGRLMMGGGDRVLRELPPSNGGKLKQDRIPLKELLQAAGIDNLDMPSDGHRSKAKGKPLRERGVVLFVTISYTNIDRHAWVPWPLDHITYEYRVLRAPYSEFSREELLTAPPSYAAARRKRYAVHIKFFQTGTIGKFSLLNILIQFVSLCSLANIARVIVDVIAKFAYGDEIARAEQDRMHRLDQLRIKFDALDKDNNGKIDKSELQVMLKDMGDTYSRKGKAEDLIEKFAPGEDSIEFSRFCMILADFSAADVDRLVIKKPVRKASSVTANADVNPEHEDKVGSGSTASSFHYSRVSTRRVTPSRGCKRRQRNGRAQTSNREKKRRRN